MNFTIFLMWIFNCVSRINQTENIGNDEEIEDGNKRKKKEKKIKYYPSFDPLKGQVCGTCKCIITFIIVLPITINT